MPPRNRASTTPAAALGLVVGLLCIAVLTPLYLWRRTAMARTAAASPLGARELEPHEALQQLRSSKKRFVVVDAKNGLGNRLRALASAMAVAEATHRSTMLVWVPDLHCNCSVRSLFASPLPFTLLEQPLPPSSLEPALFQVYNYMRPEPGAVKDAPVHVDKKRHLYFKSGFLMNHAAGKWSHAQKQLQRLVPREEVRAQVVAEPDAVGLHVRNVFDAPRDAATNASHLGKAAVDGATKEYGAEGTQQLLKWRAASHWTNFVPRIEQLIAEHEAERAGPQPLRFYLAADTDEAYKGLSERFPGRILSTRRPCPAERCDFRDCSGIFYAMVDMINLAHTRLILGSGWSSYSEVAAHLGGSGGQPKRVLMAGRDFFGPGQQPASASAAAPPAAAESAHAGESAAWQSAAVAGDISRRDEIFKSNMALETLRSNLAIQHHWLKPF